MSEDDFYEVLDLSPTASEADIRRAFLREIKKHHPDVPGAESGDRVRLLIQAKATLTDAEERRAYDSRRLVGSLARRAKTTVPKWIFVCSQGLGQYTTIGGAVEAASDGDKIYVLPGVYREALIKVDKVLEIVGQSSPGEEVVVESKHDGLYLAAGGAVLRGLSVRTEQPKAFAVVAASPSPATVSGCHFAAAEGTGIVVAEGGLVIEGCSFESCQVGVRVDRAHAAILGSKFSGGTTGILMRSGSDCIVENNDFQAHQAAGVEAQFDCLLSISRNRFAGSPTGIIVSSTARGTIDHNRFVGLAENISVLAIDGQLTATVESNSYE